MKKVATKTQLRKKCVELAKRIVRTRYPKCEYCNKGKPDVSIHGSHIYSEGSNHSMSADLDNIITLCYTHHMGGFNKAISWHNNPIEMVDWFKEKYPERYETLKQRSRLSQQIDWVKKHEELSNQLNELL